MRVSCMGDWMWAQMREHFNLQTLSKPSLTLLESSGLQHNRCSSVRVRPHVRGLLANPNAEALQATSQVVGHKVQDVRRSRLMAAGALLRSGSG
jgi:hypothetical protein